jgi:parallel beta helix pectate lyase-like protein
LTGTGIDFQGGKSLSIESCVINSWQIGLSQSFPAQLFVMDSAFRNNATGIQVSSGTGPALASIERSSFEGNLGNAVLAREGSQVSVRECVASGNFNALLTGPFGGTSDLTVENCLVLNNSSVGIGSNGFSGGVGTTRVSGCTVTGNTFGLYQNNTGVTLSRGNNTVNKNSADLQGTIGSYTAN